MEIKKFKGDLAFLVNVNPTQVVDYVCMTCYKRLNKIIRTITKESRPYQEDIWYEYGERDYKYSNLYLNDINGFIYGFDKDEEDGELVNRTLHSYEPHQCPYCGKWAYAIDIKIIPHIIELNKKGWKTQFSCSGHKNDGLFERKFEYADGTTVHRNKIYWTSPYIKFSSEVSDLVDYYMELNEKKIRYNYLPFYEYSNSSLHAESSNAINSEKNYNELIGSFLEFCESLPNIREIKKEFEEKHGTLYPEFSPEFKLKLPDSHPFFNTPFWMQDYIEKDRLWTEEMMSHFSNDFLILGPKGNIDPISLKKKLGNLDINEFETTTFIPSQLSSDFGISKLLSDLLERQITLSDEIYKLNPFDLLDKTDKAIEKCDKEDKKEIHMSREEFINIDIPSSKEIAKAMANEFETEGTVNSEVINKWKENIENNKLGLRKETQENIIEMIKMQELEDEKIRRINEVKINIWDNYLNEDGKLAIGKSQFIKDYKEVHKNEYLINNESFLDAAWRCFLNDLNDLSKNKEDVFKEYFTPDKEYDDRPLFDPSYVDEDYEDDDYDI